MFRLVCILALCWALPATAIELPQQTELEKALKELEDARSSGREIASALSKLEAELGELQDETAALASAIQRNESKLYEKESSLTILAAERDKKSAQLATQQSAFNKMISSLLQMNRVPKGALIKRDQSLQEQLRAASVAESTLQHIQNEATSLRDQHRELTKLTEKVETKKKELEAERELLLSQRGSLTRKVKARQSVYGRTQTSQNSTKRRINSLAKESKNLQTLLAKLEKEREKLRDVGTPKPKPKRKRVQALVKGNVRLPAPGTITGHFGDRKDIGETLRGITVQASPGATVTAPESGEIAFTGPFSDYGNMVIIRHSESHHFLVAGLAESSAQVGQRVILGEPLGTMGTNAPDDTEYYLELRKNGKPIDPTGWIGKLGK